MRNAVFAYLAFGAIAFSVQAAPPGAAPAASPNPVPFAPLVASTPNPNGARIEFNEKVHNFGKIKANDPLRFDFVFTNTGKATLEVTDVRPQCGCTTASPWDRKVEPGQTGKIPIQFNPGNFSGTVSKSITVTCNDSVQSVQTLQLTATIWRPVDIQPAYLYFTGVEGESTNDVKMARIVSNLDEPLTLQAPECPNPRFKAELSTVKPGKEFDLKVTYLGQVSNTVPQGVVSIKTSSTNMPVISVTAYAMPQPAVAIMPQAIRLPAGQLSNDHKQVITIRNNSSTAIQLSEPAVAAEGVKVEVNEVQPGKLFNINLVFAPNYKQTQGQPFEFTVKTSHPKNPVLRVPIMQTPTQPVLAKPATPAAVTK